jgi:hypothetical protein
MFQFTLEALNRIQEGRLSRVAKPGSRLQLEGGRPLLVLYQLHKCGT